MRQDQKIGFHAFAALAAVALVGSLTLAGEGFARRANAVEDVWLVVPDNKCEPDMANQCNAMSVECCDLASDACTSYCTTPNAPGKCNTEATKTCWLMQNVSCGTLNSCATRMPIKDEHGVDVKCDGAPDICRPIDPTGPGGT